MEKPSDHSSKTILWVTVVVGIVLVVVVWPLSQLGKADAASDGSADEAELHILPVARVEMRQAGPAADGKPRSAEAIYNTICKACHDAGVAGAPKTGDKAAWAPRIATGQAPLLKSAINGKNAMPPRAGDPTLSDDELKAAVEFLVGKAK